MNIPALKTNEIDLSSLDYIGSGKFGRVFTSKYKDKDVVCKVMKHGTWIRMFINELNILHSLQGHSGIIRLYGYIISSSKMMIVMEHAKGMTLQDLIYEEGSITYRNMLFICHQVASVMIYIHSKHIIYCDMKPSNIMINPETYVIQLIDFGLSMQLDPSNKVVWRNPCGTMGYTASEVLSHGCFGVACDVYSFGVLLYVLYTGNPPDRPIRMKKLLKKKHFDYDVYVLFCQCTQELPKYRPSFLRIYQTICKMENNYDWYKKLYDRVQKCVCCFPNVCCFLRSLFQTNHGFEKQKTS